MNAIKRNIFVLKNEIKEKIDYVRGTNEIPIHFYFTDYQIPVGATAKVFVLKKSGKAVFDECEIKNNTVIVDVKTQMFAEEGKTWMQIHLKKDEKILVTYSHPVEVYKNYINGDAENSKNESEWLEEYIAKMKKATVSAIAAKNDLIARREAGEFNGEKGADGVVTVTRGQVAFQIKNGDLIMHYHDEDMPPDVKINEAGELIMDFGG